jgi:competence protein ComGC
MNGIEQLEAHYQRGMTLSDMVIEMLIIDISLFLIVVIH